MSEFIKDPSAVLDYQFDWSDWLVADDTIQSATITASGLTVDSHTNTSDTVTVWLSGGEVGENCRVTCQVTTTAGRTDERSATIRVRQR